MKLISLHSKPIQVARVVALCGAALALPVASYADTRFTISTSVGSFLAAGSPNNPVGTNLTTLNFGSAGTFALAPASSTKGASDSVLMFSTASAVSQFNSLYGVGHWTITGVTLSLASNFGVQGQQPNNGIFNTINAGSFGIDWLADNSWVAGSGGGMGGTGYPNNNSVSYAYIPTLLSFGYDSLGTFTYTPPGNNVYLSYNLPLDGNLVSGAAAGGDVSFLLYAADNQVSYLFNSSNFASNHPELTLNVAPVPEPGTLALLTAAFGGLWITRRQKKYS